MVRLDRASSARLKNCSSTRVAEREKRLKFAPPPLRVAPRGWLLPVLESFFKVCLVIWIKSPKEPACLQHAGTQRGSWHQDGEAAGDLMVAQPVPGEVTPAFFRLLGHVDRLDAVGKDQSLADDRFPA